MSIIVDAGETPRNYTWLVSSIQDWLKNTDLETMAPDFIRFATDEFIDVFFNMEQETTEALTAAASIALPSDFQKLRSLYMTDDPLNVLTQLSLSDLRTKWANASAAKPVDFALFGSNILLGPSPDSAYDLTLAYVQGIPHLNSTNLSNWVIDRRPELYLYTALMHAEAYGWNDERAVTVIKPRLNEIWAQIRNADAIRRRGDDVGQLPVAYF